MAIASMMKMWKRGENPCDLAGIVDDLPCGSLKGFVKNFALTKAVGRGGETKIMGIKEMLDAIYE